MNLSIIVPVYNVEKYLPECLESILSQDIPGIQIICVNDGSTDSSLSILKEYEKKDSRLVVVNKHNSGYGDTMNTGMNIASGDYIGIVESDDIVIGGMLEKLLEVASDTKADVVKGTFNFYTSRPLTRKLHPNFKNFPTGVPISINNYPELFFTAPSIWSAIYRKSFLSESGIHFLPTPGASYQDTSFAFKIWAAARSVVLLPDPVIDYRQNSSDSSSNSRKKVFAIFNETAEMERFLYERKLDCFHPELVRTKFISYSWTLARLDEKSRLKFLLRWIPELQAEFEKGYFLKKYWEDYTWNYIHRLVFTPEAAVTATCKGIGIENDNFNPFLFFPQVSSVYIFGAGKYALKILRRLRNLDVRVEAAVVTDMAENPRDIGGIPVISLDNMDIDRDRIIVLGVSNKYREEVKKELQKHWLLNNLWELPL